MTPGDLLNGLLAEFANEMEYIAVDFESAAVSGMCPNFRFILKCKKFGSVTVYDPDKMLDMDVFEAVAKIRAGVTDVVKERKAAMLKAATSQLVDEHGNPLPLVEVTLPEKVSAVPDEP